MKNYIPRINFQPSKKYEIHNKKQYELDQINEKFIRQIAHIIIL